MQNRPEGAAHWYRPARAVDTGKVAPRPDTDYSNPKLYPAACSLCHRAKYADWSGSLHSRSFGPGLRTQLAPFDDPGFATSCYQCHAPLLEQSEVVAEADGYALNPAFDSELQSKGVSCVSCHMRDSVIYGPNEPSLKKNDGSVHASKRNPLFSSSKFCAACHQLDTGYSLNGRVLTNTYKEWKASQYADKGITCQKCHMPDRRHLWRGIHDREAVLSGLDIKAGLNRDNESTKTVSATLAIVSTGIGHMFPTYITPSVTVTGYLQDGSGEEIAGSRRSEVIARKIALDLSEELFDTRIPPGGTFLFTYSPATDVKQEGAVKLLIEVMVSPDEFYNRFFASMLRDAERLATDKETKSYKELKEAYRATTDSIYLLYRKTFSLKE